MQKTNRSLELITDFVGKVKLKYNDSLEAKMVLQGQIPARPACKKPRKHNYIFKVVIFFLLEALDKELFLLLWPLFKLLGSQG